MPGAKDKACTQWVSVTCNQMKRRTSASFCGYKVNILSSFMPCMYRHLLLLLIWMQWHLAGTRDPGILQQLANTTTDSRMHSTKGIFQEKSFCLFFKDLPPNPNSVFLSYDAMRKPLAWAIVSRTAGLLGFIFLGLHPNLNFPS